MKMKSSIKGKVLVIFIAAMLLLGIVSGCGNSNSTSNTSTAAASTVATSSSPEKSSPTPSEPQTIKLYYTIAQTGPITGWLGDYLLSFGLKVENIPTDDAKLQAMTVSGDLPDVIFVNNDQLNNLINAKLLLNLDEQKAKLPNVFGNVPTALKYMRDLKSNGSGNLFGVPINVGDYKINIDTGVYAINVRWDIYKAIGAPKAKTLEDLIPIFKAMQEKYPKNETGEKTYAINMFSDSDKGVRLYNMSTIFTTLGYHESANQFCINYNIKKNEVTPLLEDNEVYYRGLKFFYQLNKNGLLEPDGITQTKATSDAKIKSGAYLATGFAGYSSLYNTKDRMNAGVGYRPIIFDEYVSSTLGDYPVGSGSYFTISKNTKKLDASLKFLDLISSPDGLLTIWNGPKGELWDVDSSGKIYAKDAFFNYLSTGKHKLSSGADFVDYGNPFILRVETQHPKYNKTISMDLWPEVQEKVNDNALYKSWADNYGFKFPADLLEAQGRIAKRPLGYQSFLPALPNDLMLTRNAVTNIIVNNSWKMIYAKDENEFNRLWKETKDQVNALGYQDVVKWAKESIAKADAAAKPYIK